MRQYHRRVLRLLLLLTVAQIPRQVVLSVTIVAVWTGPVVEGSELLGCFLRKASFRFLVAGIIVTGENFLFFFLIIFQVVELLYPPLDASQVKRLVALTTVPQSAFLEDIVLTDDALLAAFGEGVNQVLALLSEVLELTEEVIGMVVDIGLVLRVLDLVLFLLGLHILDLLVLHLVLGSFI
mmetsp:Transcript_39173/g.37549  ORF Transcript_39173/g.37549 Transcript_39173/m.37549 type:complete len:181 (-) Transcript_39173:97-639(-)